MKNSFEELEEKNTMPEGSEMNLFAQINQTRSIGNVFGKFFHSNQWINCHDFRKKINLILFP